MKRFTSSLLSLGLLTCLHITVFPCTCTDYGVPVCKLFHDADAVFTGRVTNITSAAGDKNASVSLSRVNSTSYSGVELLWVQFAIEKGLKGVTGKTVKVLISKGTSCDVNADVGQRWLIFASKDPKTGYLSFGACSGSYELDKDTSEVDELARIASGKAPTSVTGRVVLNDYTELKDAKVTLSNGAVELSTVTDADGRFSFDVPAEGEYKVKVVVPYSSLLMFVRSTLRDIRSTPTETETTFEYTVKAVRGDCDYQLLNTFKIDLKATASISGRFIAENWKFFPQFRPRLCKLLHSEKETLDSCELTYPGLSPDGTFAAEGLREGNYTIVVNEDDEPDGSNFVRRHYYPGVRNFADAQAIKLEQGEEKKGIVFKLPPMLPMRRVVGQLFRRDGQPLTLSAGDASKLNLSIYKYRDGEEPELMVLDQYTLNWGEKSPKEVNMIDLIDNTRFAAMLFEGYRYVLTAQTNTFTDKSECGATKVDVNASLVEPIRIVIDQKGRCDLKRFADARTTK